MEEILDRVRPRCDRGYTSGVWGLLGFVSEGLVGDGQEPANLGRASGVGEILANIDDSDNFFCEVRVNFYEMITTEIGVQTSRQSKHGGRKLRGHRISASATPALPAFTDGICQPHDLRRSCVSTFSKFCC